MKEKDLLKLVELKKVLDSEEVESEVRDAIIEDPAREVESSLVSFVTYRFNKVKESVNYEEGIKKVIFERISEATFPQLINLLQTIQRGNADSTNSLLAPFIDQSNGRTLPENLRESQREDHSSGAEIFKDVDDKSVLQAFNALTQVLDHIAAQEEENS